VYKITVFRRKPKRLKHWFRKRYMWTLHDSELGLIHSGMEWTHRKAYNAAELHYKKMHDKFGRFYK